MGVFAGIAAAVGVSRGILSAVNRVSKRKDKINELNNTISDIKTQESNLTANYDLQKVANQQVVADTVSNRDTSLNQSANSRTQQDVIAQGQLASIAVDASKAEGQAVQQVATSGFRKTGSAMNNVENTEMAATDSMNSAKSQLSLSRYADYQSALNSYTSANQQIASYQAKMQQMQQSYNQQMQSYQTQLSRAQSARKDLTGFWGTAGTVVGSVLDIAGGLMDGLSGASHVKTAWTDIFGG